MILNAIYVNNKVHLVQLVKSRRQRLRTAKAADGNLNLVFGKIADRYGKVV